MTTINAKVNRAESWTSLLTASAGVSIGATCSLAEGVPLVTGTTTGSKIGQSASAKLGFYGVTPVVQPAAAAQAAVSGATATLSAYGFEEAQANALIALVNAMRTALVNTGLMKGQA